MTALLTIAEVADELRLSPDSVRRLVAAGKLPVVYPVARRPRIARAALVWRAGDSVWISGRKRTPYAGMNHDWYLGSHRFPPTHWMSLPKPPVDNPVDKSA